MLQCPKVNSVTTNSFSLQEGNHNCKYVQFNNKELTFNILYTNVDVLTSNKLGELRTLAEQNKYDIIALTEIYPKNSFFDKKINEKYMIKGYEQFFAKESERGTAIYVKSELKATEIDSHVDYNEGVFIEIHVLFQGKDKLLTGCIYKSPYSQSEKVVKMFEFMKSFNILNYVHVLIGKTNQHKQMKTH